MFSIHNAILLYSEAFAGYQTAYADMDTNLPERFTAASKEAVKSIDAMLGICDKLDATNMLAQEWRATRQRVLARRVAFRKALRANR